MGYTFKSLCIRNFKYITNNKPLKFDFMNSNIVILDGQNGYGKTTLFDAIEVLVTGKIKHFNPSLQNRKTETLGTLANDVNKDIVISAILSSDFSDEIHVERKLLCKNEFQSIITLNSQEISQEELYDKFHLSSNMFDISAISLADLLTQQGIGQIVLSTHEEAKAALLRYKFKHAGMSVREQNMQALYMKTVTEE